MKISLTKSFRYMQIFCTALLESVFIVLVLISISILTEDCARAQIVETGGSDYVAIGLSANNLKDPSNWRQSTLFHAPGCATLKYQNQLKDELMTIYNSGQRKLSVILWYSHLNTAETCQGYLLNTANINLIPEAIENIQSFLNLSQKIGFNEVQIRFAAQWISDPSQWTEWEEDRFNENLQFIDSLTSQLQAPAHLNIIYDLGLELGGIVKTPYVEAYVKRIWTVLGMRIGTSRTYGFSIACSAGRLQRTIQWLRSVGPLPTEFALDVYDSPGRIIATASAEANQSGIPHPTFLIQETYYNNAAEYSSLLLAAQLGNLKIRAVMQWPKDSILPGQVNVDHTYKYNYWPRN